MEVIMELIMFQLSYLTSHKIQGTLKIILHQHSLKFTQHQHQHQHQQYQCRRQ